MCCSPRQKKLRTVISTTSLNTLFAYPTPKKKASRRSMNVSEPLRAALTYQTYIACFSETLIANRSLSRSNRSSSRRPRPKALVADARRS
jgi:hypothetical protein